MRARLVTFGIVLVAVLAFAPLAADRYAAAVAGRLLREATSRPVRFASASLALPSGPFALRGLEIPGRPGEGPLLRAGRVEICVSPWDLPGTGPLEVAEVLVEDLRLGGDEPERREFFLDVEAAARLLAGGSGDRPVRIGKVYLGRTPPSAQGAEGSVQDPALPPAVIERPGGEEGIPASRLLGELLPLLLPRSETPPAAP